MITHYILNSFTLFTGIFGLIISSILIRSIRTNSVSNIFLVILFSVISLRLIILGGINLNGNERFYDFSRLLNILFLIGIPCMYLYFEFLLEKQEENAHKRKWIHFLAPLLLMGINLLQNNFGLIPQKMMTLMNYTIILGMILLYLAGSWRIYLRKIKLDKKRIHKTLNKTVRQWLILLLMLYVLLSLRALITLTMDILNRQRLTENDNSLFLVSVIWFLVFLRLLFVPEILHGTYALQKRISSVKNELTDELNYWELEYPHIHSESDLKIQQKIGMLIPQIIDEIEMYCQQAHPFRDMNCSINSLALKLGRPTSHVSYVFKYHSTISFSEYRTKKRIEDAIQLIKTGFLATNTMDSLAIHIGYASYNPFFTAFKKQTGSSPIEFAKKQIESIDSERGKTVQ